MYPSTISTLNIYLIAIIILSSLLVCLIVFVNIYFCKKKKHKKEVVELLDKNHIEDNNTNENAIIFYFLYIKNEIKLPLKNK